MKTVRILSASAALLLLVACGASEDDRLENVEANAEAEQLDALADNAAAQAELEALNDQQEQIESASEPAPPTVDSNATDPAQVEDDVQGM